MAARRPRGRDSSDVALEIEVSSEQVSEIGAIEAPDGASFQALDRGVPWRIAKQRDFTEEVARFERGDPASAPLLSRDHLD
jgi:hypothetical protein